MPNIFTIRWLLVTAGCMLAPQFCGCFPAPAVPPISQPPAALDPPAKGIIRGPHSSSAAIGLANTKPPAVRTLLLRSGWCAAGSASDDSPASVYAQAIQPSLRRQTDNFRYRHAGLEDVMAGPADRRAELRGLLDDKDRNVAATAAIAMARQGDAEVAERLLAAVNDEDLPLPARCAAVEALGLLPGDTHTATLQKLVDRYGQFTPGASTGYQVDLHAELLRALGRHINASDDPRFLAAVDVPSASVRVATLDAWAGDGKGDSAHDHASMVPAERPSRNSAQIGTVPFSGVMPSQIVDLRSDDDPRVRAAALKALVARNHPQACDFLGSAVHDVDLQVRLTAIRCLGRLDEPQARTILTGLLKDRGELIRAEAVGAIAVRGSRAVVLGAASDASWRVRLKVAEVLATYGDGDGAVAARRLLNDSSGEVERQVVRSLAAWPWEVAAPVLLDALTKNAVTVRKLAAEQLFARWPEGGRFPYEASPSRRAQVLTDLQSRYERALWRRCHSQRGRA